MLHKIKKVFSKSGPELVRTRVKDGIRKVFSKDGIKFNVAPYLLQPYIYYQLRRRETPPKFLFVLSTMRSGSTLLTHILNNNPDISGTIEHSSSYKSLTDLNILVSRVAVYNASYNVRHQQYFLDKMVWNYHLGPAILASKRSKFIFLVREPEANFSSMARLIPKLRDPQKALKYYTRRLDHLSYTAATINDPSRCLVVHYEDLLDDTTSVLEQLRTFLGVALPFSETYTLLEETGTLKYGDNSDMIKTGAVVRDRGIPEHFFSAATIGEAAGHYKVYLRTLEQHSETYKK